MSKDILSMDATHLYEEIVSGDMTSYEITKTYIIHLKNNERKINAIVEDRFDLALEEAKDADQYLKNYGKPIGPLHGVPICVKESFDVEGMKTTGGLIHLKDNIAKKDAHIVKRLRDAGAIVLCKTNTSTLCYAQESVNKLYGTTNNPWDLSRTAGGSSGGEGAILAIGGAAAGIGSDLGCSNRLPFHFNSVIGYKSGMFQIDQTGHFPPTVIPIQKRMSTSRPMKNCARDMKTMYHLTSKKHYEKTELENITIQILPEDQPFPLSSKSKKTNQKIEAYLTKNFNIDQNTSPYFNDSALLWQEMMSSNGSDEIKKITFNRVRKNVVFTYIKEKFTKNTPYHEYLRGALLGSTPLKPSKKRLKEIESILQKGDELLHKHFKELVLILPVYHPGAQQHGNIFKETC